MKLTRLIGLVAWPTIFTAYVLAMAAAAALPWLPSSLTAPETWSLLAAAGAGAIMLWLLTFWVLRRRYVRATLHPEADAPPLHLGQWLEVGLGSMAVGAAVGLAAYAVANMTLGGLAPGDVRLGPVAAIGGLAMVLAGWVIRGAARWSNRRAQVTAVAVQVAAAAERAPAPAPPRAEPAPAQAAEEDESEQAQAAGERPVTSP